jgi:hypothetical protein
LGGAAAPAYSENMSAGFTFAAARAISSPAAAA